MARMIDAKCRQCRRSGEKLFLKGERCFSQKCAMVKRPYAPGAHGAQKKKGRRGFSEYGRQLAEKQRVKKIYGVLERQFKKYFLEASQSKGDTRENLIKILEKRLDNVIFRLGFAPSRAAARQLVNHGHITVNGRRLDIPSYSVRVGDVLSLKEKVKKSKLFENLAAFLKKYETPRWLVLEKEKLEGKVNNEPTAEDFDDLMSIGLIVEFYSR